MIKRLYIFLLFCLATGVGNVSAQYYSWGADPTSLRWKRMHAQNLSIIYPDTATHIARSTMFYATQATPYIGYGFKYGPMNIPFVIHAENFSSNGLVMWLPKRIEFISSPAIDSYSMPWLKQLVAHEYRHAVQYNNLNRGVVRVFSYIIGQQSSTIGLLFLPLWLIEGDAVMSETAMSSYGRGLQPSFTIDYRAAGDFINSRRNTDKWFCGSYKENIPDHYHIGYQIASYTDAKYGHNIWNEVASYGVRRPYTIATTAVALKKYHNTSVSRLTRETFDELNRHWAAMPPTSDTAQQLKTPEPTSFTTYSFPIADTLGGGIISIKTDLDRTSRIVRTDEPTGIEQLICHTGRISTRPTLQGSRLWWTEYRASTLFRERVNSRLCYIDLDSDHTPHTVEGRRNSLYPTAIGAHELAWVEYFPNGRYRICRGTAEQTFWRAEIGADIEIHSLAYDNYTKRLYFIATDDSGMWLGRVTPDRRIEHLTRGAYITLSNLRAADGRLYFGSIASGKDEIHCYDILTDKEYRITSSHYGSFGGSPVGRDSIVLTTYDRRGYTLAAQRFDIDSLKEVLYSRLPRNVVNPERKRWNVINLDTVNFSAADTTLHSRRYRQHRYNSIAHFFNVHSWAPASFDPFEISEDGQFNFNLGATIMSQNLLSTTQSFFTWGWNATEGSLYKGTIRYNGLGVNLAASFTYGGTQLLYNAYTFNTETGKIETPDAPHLGKYYNVSASASLPLIFDCGYRTRILTLTAAWNYSNGLVANTKKLHHERGHITNMATIGFKEGMHTLQFMAGYQQTVRLAHRDFAPRSGIVTSLQYAMNPADAQFSDLLAAYGKVYLPGIWRHHSLTVAALYQTSVGGFSSDSAISYLTYRTSRLIPRGFNSSQIYSHNYVATSVNYQLPVWYPDGGIASVLYFKRIRLNAGYDFATFTRPTLTSDGGVANVRHKLHSYGGDISIDFNVFRQPASATSSLTISIYKPSKGSVYISTGLGLPF